MNDDFLNQLHTDPAVPIRVTDPVVRVRRSQRRIAAVVQVAAPPRRADTGRCRIDVEASLWTPYIPKSLYRYIVKEGLTAPLARMYPGNSPRFTQRDQAHRPRRPNTRHRPRGTSAPQPKTHSRRRPSGSTAKARGHRTPPD